MSFYEKGKGPAAPDEEVNPDSAQTPNDKRAHPTKNIAWDI